ncbi:MAG: alpha-L-fucosidase [Thermoguttaceae bacterium]|jgi:alpha-L-fucosidase
MSLRRPAPSSVILLALSCLSAVAGPAAAAEKTAPPAESKSHRDARMAWWREARFGMFIHWGVYSVPAGTYQGKPVGGIGEWIMHNGKIPVAEYRKFAARFNPVRFDADAWVRTAKEAGTKYIVITSKHHDGFAMFESKASDWCITKASPFQRDPLAELSKACRRQGIKLGFYYSQAQDWNNPGGATYDGHWDKAQDGDMDKYLDTVAVPQVREILSNYGPVAVLWWDTPANMTRQRAEKFLPLLKLQPGLITNNRLGGGFSGDTETPEQFVPATGYPGRDWETCMTMNDTWGYKSDDHNWKSSETLIRNLVDIASKGGNYLLNVGPTSEGLIPAPSVERLKEVGRWMQINGEAIYGTAASPFKKLPWGRCTRKPGKLYLHVFDWPQGELAVPGLRNKITTAYLLADAARSPLEATAGDGGVRIKLPPKAPSPPVSVVVLEIEGEPEVAPQLLGQAADGSITLAAADAVVHGETAQYESGGGKDNIGFWTNSHDWVSWDFGVKQPGRFEATVTYACEPGSAGSRYTMAVGPAAVHGEVEATGDWAAFVTRKLGVLEIPAAGPAKLTVKPDSMPHGAVMNLKAVRLTPVKP